ncbi:DNA repair protein rad8 [Podospora australis]|uniref:DNA repair protein rad8 n=1 Tax=Podospora australis TaxID=1536484 RepID=A0AAN6WYY5_9PEZI|nr:DNA repair protein rad8 [Podospora australis]
MASPEGKSALTRWIAAGCLVIRDIEVGSLLNFEHAWHHFHTAASPDNLQPILTQNVQDRLLGSECLKTSCAALLLSGWIHLSIRGDIVRVYVLPDDIDNRSIPRVNPRLRKCRKSLLSQLDYSRTTWHDGIQSSVASPYPSLFGKAKATSQSPNAQSLLEMFNNIPSPSPKPDEVKDWYVQDAMFNLLASKVPGLHATLYAYQRRSAALMLERESQPRQVLDPRLIKVVDQVGNHWFYDSVEGSGLLEPRFYGTPSGGILAEEMGSGKTLICLALILGTRHMPSSTPQIYQTDTTIKRPRVGALMDMAAACITRNSVPWREVFGSNGSDGEWEYSHCVEAIRRNAGSYDIPPPQKPRSARRQFDDGTPTTVYHSHASLVIAPPNLVQQWQQEIAKHTSGLRMYVIDKKKELPSPQDLVELDILLFSSTRFERLFLEGQALDPTGILSRVHFKRCIVDEGHKLGNSTASSLSNLHLTVDRLHITSRWIVTGTPSKGLFGVDDTAHTNGDSSHGARHAIGAADLENDDLKRIGSIASLYLHMRPWANTITDRGDTKASWSVYVMKSDRSQDCLRNTLDTLIIRHRLSEISHVLPVVEEKVVYLDGSYQDIMVLNLFSMMIIFNAVQSERTDQDYLFHPRQRKALVELVGNLRQASFFGGSFFSPAQIAKSVATAEEFLEDGKVQISSEDEKLLLEAIRLGKLALQNNIKECANLFRELPVYVKDFPWAAGREWSLDGSHGDMVCTTSGFILELQKFLQPLVDAPASLQMMFENGRFAERGRETRLKAIQDQNPDNAPTKGSKTLAGNTELGEDSNSPVKRRSTILGKGLKVEPAVSIDVKDMEIAAPLAKAQIVSTASAKLSYLVDQVLQHQKEEQIIIFYENDNVAYYLASMLEILQVQHLIYARGLTPERRAQYVATFNHNPKFRVLLMDITQAAFGLDMKSASRIYFINPVLNPQVEAQAIGRARRISQQKPVTVETLVLRGSVEEVIIKRRAEMTQAEQWKCRSILDDKPIYEWILNAKILPLPNTTGGPDEMARLETPQFIFGRDFGRELEHPDQDLFKADGTAMPRLNGLVNGTNGDSTRKRRAPGSQKSSARSTPAPEAPVKKARVRFAGSDDDDES